MLELKAKLRKVRMKRKDDPEMLSSTPSAIKNKYKNAAVSVDETELVVALIDVAPKDYLNTQKGQMEQDMFPATVKG